MKGYQGLIHETLTDRYGSELTDSLLPDPETVCAWVESWMRLERGCLDSLGEPEWTREVTLAMACVAASTEAENQSLARSYGLTRSA